MFLTSFLNSEKGKGLYLPFFSQHSRLHAVLGELRPPLTTLPAVLIMGGCVLCPSNCPQPSPACLILPNCFMLMSRNHTQTPNLKYPGFYERKPLMVLEFLSVRSSFVPLLGALFSQLSFAIRNFEAHLMLRVN